jgi:hypothetical protein
MNAITFQFIFKEGQSANGQIASLVNCPFEDRAPRELIPALAGIP